MEDPDRAIEAGDVADVTNSNAFVSIDHLLDSGTIPEDRAVMLKSRYKELHDRVLQIYANDNFLLRRARQFKKDLEGEKLKVERCGEVAQRDDKSITALKKELAAAEHDLSVAQERESMLQVEALELDRKRQTLTHDVEESIQQEHEKLRPRIEAIKADIDQLGRDIDKKAADFDTLKADREGLLEEETSIRASIEHQNGVSYDTKMEFARVEREPDRARKQADIVVRAAATAEKEVRNFDDKIRAVLHHMGEGSKRKEALNQQIFDLEAALKSNEKELLNQRQNDKHLSDNINMEVGQIEILSRRNQEFEDGLTKKSLAINAERDGVNRALRDKEQGLKNFKKLEQSKADLENESDMSRKQLEILSREGARLQQQRAKTSEELEELKREVDILINAFLREEISERRCISDKTEMTSLIKRKEDEVVVRAAEEQRLKREAAALSVHREQMSRDCSRNLGKVQLAASELKVKDVVLLEFNKRHEDLVARLGAVVDHWHRVKRERSAKAQLIQTNSQTMSETQEKIKILENELEVLRRESLIKDQDLKRKQREHHEHDQVCKNLRVERNRWFKKLEAARHKEEDLKRQMSKLNSVITSTEDEMLRLKEAYEEAVENRNYTGIQLIDRNDELCILYEKANIQEGILKNGMTQLNQRDENIRSAAIELADLERDIDLCQKVLPQVRDVEEDLAELMLRLEEERWKAEVLENDLTDPANATRWRKIGKVGAETKAARAKLQHSKQQSSSAKDGSLPGGGSGSTKDGGGGEAGPASEDLVELSRKQQVLEERLAHVNEKLMEKDLILEEITELSNRLRRQALNGRDFTLALAKRVNGYQYGIKGKTKKMMATLSELSMVQASSIKLEMDVQAMESRIAEARQRAEEGEAPSEEVVHQYEKDRATTLRRKEMHEQRKQRAAEEAVAVPGAVQTTAPQRTTAYLQGDSELQLPVPYGSHAPMMAQHKHNVARFYRKEKVKPLDFDEDE